MVAEVHIGQTFTSIFFIGQSTLAKRGRTRLGKWSYPYVKHSTADVPIDPAILAVIGYHFIAKSKRKLKMPTRGSEAMRSDTRNQRLFCKICSFAWISKDCLR